MMFLYRRKHSARRADRLTPGLRFAPSWATRRPVLFGYARYRYNRRVSCRGRYGKHRRALFFLRGSSRAVNSPFFGRGFSWGRRGRPRHGEHSLVRPRRPGVVVRHPNCCCVARTALRRRLFPDARSSARSGIVGLSRDLGWRGANDMGSALLWTARVMLAGLPLAAVGVWLLFWPGIAVPTGSVKGRLDFRPCRRKARDGCIRRLSG